MIEDSLELILIADNNPKQLEMNELAFREAGYTPEEGYDVMTFASAEELRDFYNADGHRQRVKLVVTDNQMGSGLTGLDLARTLGSLVFVLSSTPRLPERAKNDPSLGEQVAKRIYNKQSPTAYQDIMEAAVRMKALRKISYTPDQIADACADLEDGQELAFKLKPKEGFERNLEVVRTLKALYFKLGADRNYSYVSCEGETFSPRASKWSIGDKENIFYRIEHREQMVTVTKLAQPIPRQLRQRAVGIYIDRTARESKLLMGTERALQEKPGELYGVFGSMFSARHFARHSEFYTSNIN